MAGYYVLPKPYVAYDLNWLPERLDKASGELLRNGLIKYCEQSDVVLIPNFLKYNPMQNKNQAIGAARLDADEVTKFDLGGLSGESNIVSESGLYNVILRSDKPKAKKFRRWVTHEILPSIRKHGAYMTPLTIEKFLADPDFGIQLLTRLKAEQARNAALAETVSIQKQQIAELTPKASYYDVVLNCKDAVSTTTIAKDYGKSARWLNDYLHKLGVQFKQGRIWFLYQRYAEKGYTCTKTHSYLGRDGEYHSKVHTYWTQKGRLFIYELLKSKGILPLIEQSFDCEVVGDGLA